MSASAAIRARRRPEPEPEPVGTVDLPSGPVDGPEGEADAEFQPETEGHSLEDDNSVAGRSPRRGPGLVSFAPPGPFVVASSEEPHPIPRNEPTTPAAGNPIPQDDPGPPAHGGGPAKRTQPIGRRRSQLTKRTHRVGADRRSA